MADIRKYGPASATERVFYFPLQDPTTKDFTSGLSFVAGDVKLMKDGAAFANTSALPTDEGNGWYSLTLTQAEMQCKVGVVNIVDQTSPKTWDDQGLVFHTGGNASALHDGL